MLEISHITTIISCTNESRNSRSQHWWKCFFTSFCCLKILCVQCSISAKVTEAATIKVRSKWEAFQIFYDFIPFIGISLLFVIISHSAIVMIWCRWQWRWADRITLVIYRRRWNWWCWISSWHSCNLLAITDNLDFTVERCVLLNLSCYCVSSLELPVLIQTNSECISEMPANYFGSSVNWNLQGI